MSEKTIHVQLTDKQLKFLINQIHVDNSFRKTLEAVYEENMAELPTRAEVTE